VPGEEGPAARRVVITRKVDLNPRFLDHPLTINPADLSVGTLEGKWPWSLTRRFIWQNRCYYRDFDFVSDTSPLVRADLPDFEPEIVIPDVPQGEFRLQGDTLHIPKTSEGLAGLTESLAIDDGAYFYRHGPSCHVVRFEFVSAACSGSFLELGVAAIPERPDSGFVFAFSATQGLAKLIQQAEERRLPAIPSKESVNEFATGAKDLCRNVDQGVTERNEVHSQQRLLLVSVPFFPASIDGQ
jgi:hypothetical protein